MIDIHSHILPAMDDGPGSWAESLSLCRLLAAQGVRTVVATPHYWPGVYEPRAGLIEQRVMELNLLLCKQGVDMTALAGEEVVFCPEIRELLAKRAVLTLNGSRYVLLELPQLMAEEQLFAGIFQLQLEGYVPVIAHPEKNRMIQGDPGLMLELVCKGALGQMTASSLLGSAPGKIRTCGQNLVRRRTVQIISSDAHSIDGRPPRLAQGLEQAACLLKSRREAEKMVLECPQKIIQDRRLGLPEAQGNKKKKGGFLRQLCKEAFG
ncbi:MAG: hypothetical protein K9K64_07355 [Desulfohalobiaceae bacterium]|nr:hypothetical protein [Desulfohalobiaceae bacterium]